MKLFALTLHVATIHSTQHLWFLTVSEGGHEEDVVSDVTTKDAQDGLEDVGLCGCESWQGSWRDKEHSVELINALRAPNGEEVLDLRRDLPVTGNTTSVTKTRCINDSDRIVDLHAFDVRKSVGSDAPGLAPRFIHSQAKLVNHAEPKIALPLDPIICS